MKMVTARDHIGLYTGAVLMTTSQSFISRAISWFEHLATPDKFEPSHVAVVEFWSSDIWDGMMWESTIGGVQRSRISKYISDKHITYLACYLPFAPSQRQRIIKAAAGFEGREYGYLDLGVYLGDILLSKLLRKKVRWFTQHFNTNRVLVCSELVGYAYWLGARYKFRDCNGKMIKPSGLRPDHIYAHIIRNPSKWMMVQVSPPPYGRWYQGRSSRLTLRGAI